MLVARQKVEILAIDEDFIAPSFFLRQNAERHELFQVGRGRVPIA